MLDLTKTLKSNQCLSHVHFKHGVFNARPACNRHQRTLIHAAALGLGAAGRQPSITFHASSPAHLRGRVVSLAGQDAEVARGGDGYQALDVLHKLLVVFGVPEHHAVLLPLRLGEGVDHRAAAVAPLREKQCKVWVSYTSWGKIPRCPHQQ